jgi:hypothetical protein
MDKSLANETENGSNISSERLVKQGVYVHHIEPIIYIVHMKYYYYYYTFGGSSKLHKRRQQ